MQLSYFMMPIHHPSKDYRAALEEDIEAIVLADRLGFAEAWVGEHYSSKVEQITSPLLFMSNLIARTERIKLATGVVCMPQYHPAVIAGQAAMFDQLSDGRLILGIGPGGLPSDIELFDTAENDRGEMMIEAIDTVLALWQGDPPYDIEGKYWKTRIGEWNVDELGLGTMARPMQRPHPPIAVSAMSPYSGIMRLAAVRDWFAISANFVAPWVVRSHWTAHVDECAKQGREPQPHRWHVARSIFVAESDDEAEDFVAEPGGAFDYYFEYLFSIFDRAGMRKGTVLEEGMDPAEMDHEKMRDRLVIRGSARTVTERLLAFRDEVGDFGTLVMTAHDWTEPERLKRSMELMAEQVMPELNAAIA